MELQYNHKINIVHCLVMEKHNEMYETMALKTIPNTQRTMFLNKRNGMDVSDIEGARPRCVEKPHHQR
jgi:hypothetical protein